ncbi:MAG TPA: hypothetical protein PLV68_00910 [Ilumatobacteraceae bacterium]|nr:hypothetical protein [Ilumatobacteraceae bacterium]
MASHRLGLALIGMPRYQSNLVEVTSGGLHRIPGVVTHRSLRPLPHTTVRGVPTTAPARTLIDVGCLVSQALLARWTTTWVSERVVTVTELESEMAAARGHRGVPLLRAVLDDLDRRHEVADSPVEAKLGMLLEDNGFPPLTLHHVVTVSSGAEFELDWSYPQWQIGFEVDGYGVHLRSHESFDHDRFRRNELVIDGWTILNFSGRQVARRSRTVLDQARRALTERSLLP